MHVRDILKKRYDELKGSIALVEAELRDIELALGAMERSTKSEEPHVASTANRFQIRHSMPVNDAVVLAVEAGRKTPVAILDYIRNELHIDTTINSVRTRVTPLNKDGKIAHDGTGWVPANYNQPRLAV